MKHENEVANEFGGRVVDDILTRGAEIVPRIPRKVGQYSLAIVR